ncbi:MAG TPA: carboxypeptidase regulatory-like domain-containing protein [Xanthobacteraceae bacterium]|nr:carboxypeptidase regulatory-like domain-containing protein [Xanthobacteraceae bacterium]
MTCVLGMRPSFLAQQRVYVRPVALCAVLTGLVLCAGPSMAQVMTQVPSPSALSGKVTSQVEGAMEGVLVSAKRAGSTTTTTVVTDAQGQYSFPRERMEPGRYSVAIRAVGYELPGAKTAQVEVMAQGAAALDINLIKTRNLAAQLSNGEWLQSFTGTEQRKEGLYRCVSCHTLERIAKSTYDAAGMAQVVQRMTTWAQGSQPIRPQPQLGRSIGTPNAAQIAFGQYLSTINLSSSGEWPYTLKTDPRPKGKATRVIITEYDLPRREAMPHDAQMDMRGMVWYGDFGSQYVGSLDPKTGKTTEYVVPITKPGAPTGNLDIRFDRDGMIWIGSMMQGSLVKFDPKYQKFESWGAPDFLKRNDARIAMVMPEQTHVDGKVWIGADNEYQVDMATGEWTEIDYRKMQPPGAKDHGSYGVAADSKNNFYGLELNADYIIKVDSKNLIPTYYRTPTANSGPRRGHFDDQDRLWFAENRGHRIGMFDAKTETFQEWKTPTPYSMPYDAIYDNSTYAWTGGMGNDHVSRLNAKTGEVIDYLLPSKTNIRRVDVDKSVNPSQLWIGNNHGATIIKVEPLEP